MTKYIWNIDYPLSVIVLSVVYFIINILYWFNSKRPTDKVLFIHLLIDIIELSVFFYLTGGASNPFTWFLLIPIIFSATALIPFYTWILTGISILSYTLLIKFFQPVENSMDMSMMNHQNHTTSFNQHLIGMWLGFIVIAIIGAWVIIGLLKNIRRKEYLLMQASLKQAENDKILALATLATGSAHELGTPLATVNILVKELLNDTSISQHHKSLELIESQVYRCKQSLTQITASTGTTQAVKGAIEGLGQFIEQLKEKIIPPSNIEFNFNSTDVAGYLLVDKTLLQAVINIINNAFESQATKVVVSTSTSETTITITIEDNGEGMQQQFGEHMTSEKDFGMGLGLFLAQATIQRFGGTIKLDKTDLPHGSRLVISLPAVTNKNDEHL
jgi:two-component system sensor histidine kinase RegB